MCLCVSVCLCVCVCGCVCVCVCVCAVWLLYAATHSRIYSKSLISLMKSPRALTFYVRTTNVNRKCVSVSVYTTTVSVCLCTQQLHVEETGCGNELTESVHLTNRTSCLGGGLYLLSLLPPLTPLSQSTNSTPALCTNAKKILELQAYVKD